MKLVNRDMTRESIQMFISEHQIYAQIWSKTRTNKWSVDEYFKSYSFEVDEDLIKSSIKEIVRLWGLKAPKIIVIK